MTREFSGVYCSYSSFPRKRESRGCKAAAIALDPRFRGGDDNQSGTSILSQAVSWGRDRDQAAAVEL
jgi:hypothetical protein